MVVFWLQTTEGHRYQIEYTDYAMRGSTTFAQDFNIKDFERLGPIVEWVSKNADVKPGTVAAICGRLHVASYGTDGKVNLYPILDL
jgi:hypothetical protein